MPAKLRKNHYLPEFYTRRWCNSDVEMVRFRRKPDGLIEARRCTPGGIGFSRGLYTMPNQESDHLSEQIEDGLFRLVDQFGAEISEKMLNGQVPKNAPERTRWAAFVLSLLHRSPKDIVARKRAFQSLARVMNSESDPEELAVGHLWESVNNPRIGTVLVNMVWDIVDVSAGGVSLLAADAPLIVSNGLKPPDGNYALPLSPTTLFITSWPGPERDAALRGSMRAFAKRANLFTVQRAREFVIATDDRQRAFVEKHFATHHVESPIEGIAERYARDPAAGLEDVRRADEADWPY